MKICLAIPSMHLGGAERQFLQIALGLSKTDEILVLLTRPGGDLYESLLSIPGIKVVVLSNKKNLSIAQVPILFSRMILELSHFKPKVIYSFLPTMNFFSLLSGFITGIRVVIGIRASNMNWKLYNKMQDLLSRFEVSLSSLATKIICNSQAGYNHCLKRGFPEDKLQIIFNGINLDYFHFDESAGNAMRSTWRIKNDVPLIGMAARLDQIKAHDVFFRAIVKAKQLMPNSQYVCIGDDKTLYGHKMHKLSQELFIHDCLTWAGKVQNMPAAYSALTLHTLTSRSEGLPNTVAESMACGIPQVCTDVGDTAWLLENSGDTIPVDAPDALAKSWYALLNEPENLFKKRKICSRNKIVQDVSLSVMLKCTRDMLYEVVNY